MRGDKRCAVVLPVPGVSSISKVRYRGLGQRFRKPTQVTRPAPVF